MRKEQFENKEAKSIARWILGRLEMVGTNLDREIKLNKRVKEVIGGIESIEDSWTYETSNNSETYGRKVKEETIKLWSVPRISTKLLSYLVLYAGAKNILEVGTSAGYSAIHLGLGAEQTQGHVFTIENLKVKSELARNHFKKADLEKIISLIEGNAEEVISQWASPIDLVFLDADKENYGKYLDLLLPNMKAGSIIIADNINDYGHMMEDYLIKVFGTHFPNSRTYPNVISTSVRSVDNGLAITKVIRGKSNDTKR